ncbi:hypothetical protein ALC60_11632 [Trachymyrmex zeteki]|uniref:Uncharacterized protein n=1 Tax=Mycetomoellerius zeteki TaxID=64791 RepID=A0A151WNA3_9HYME|nr:hypothetical protein ALC60_11632 [Trachymyrmex zeteki]
MSVSLAFHCQNIERVWRDMRANIPRYGTREKHYINYVAEFNINKDPTNMITKKTQTLLTRWKKRDT